MVRSFRFSRLPSIHFGSGMLTELPGLISRYGSRVMLVTGRESFAASAYTAGLSGRPSGAGFSVHHVVIPGEPSPEMIDAEVLRFMGERTDVVVAAGGGSAMDAGKAISAMLTTGGTVTDYLEGVGTRTHPGTKIPFIAVPTTAGTGSEATKNAVISRTGKNGFKKSLRHDNFVPDVAIVDPDLTINCPPGITAASGMDCFSQLTEAFLSEKSNSYTDALCIEGIKAIKNCLDRAFHDGSDIEARTGMSFAALTSGICLANAGLGTVHGFASSVGGWVNIPHGILCGTLMAPANEITVRELRKSGDREGSLRKYAILGKIFLDDNGKTDEYYIDAFIDLLYRMTEDLQLPGLDKFGLRKDQIQEICSITENKNNPYSLSTTDMAEILARRL